MGEKKRWTASGSASLLWVVLHFYTSVSALGYGLYQTYTTRFWILLGVWLVGLLALDAWLAAGRSGLLRFAKWYWAFSAALALGALLVAALRLSLDGALAVGLLCLLLTPLYQLLAFAWLLFEKLAGMRGSTRFSVVWSAILLFCLIHFVYFAWLHHRARQRGATPHGPVDPGAGAVE